MLSLERRRRRMRRGHRSLEAQLGRTTFVELQRLKRFEVTIKAGEKQFYRSLLSKIRKMFAKSKRCGKRKKMINLVNYLERIKSLDKLLCESKLSILKSSRAGFLQKKLSQKYII